MTFSFKRADELQVGEIVCGTRHGGRWSRSYEVVEPVVDNTGQVRNTSNSETLPWHIMGHTMVTVEETSFKYDPNQTGDTEEDI